MFLDNLCNDVKVNLKSSDVGENNYDFIRKDNHKPSWYEAELNKIYESVISLSDDAERMAKEIVNKVVELREGFEKTGKPIQDRNCYVISELKKYYSI